MKQPAVRPEPDKDLPLRWALLLLLALPSALFFPALLGGKMLWGMDIQALGLVFNNAVQRGFAHGEWPLWMPELLGGMPGIAATNLVFLHPSELLGGLLRMQPWAMFGLDAALQVGLSGLGMFLLLRRLGASRAGALLGGIFLAASGSQCSLLYAGHTNNLKAIAMLPWVFWGLHKGWQERKALGWALAGAALALQVLGLGLQVFAYTILGVVAFVVWLAWAGGGKGSREKGERDSATPDPVKPTVASPFTQGTSNPWWTGFSGLCVAALFLILLSAPQLLPSLRYKAYSWREGFSYDTFTSWSFHPKESLTWIVPGFWGWMEPTYHGDWPFCLTTEYFGLLPWLLCFAAVAAAWTAVPAGRWRAWWKRPEGFFTGLAVFSYLAGLGKYFPLHHLFFHLPVYQGFRTWARFLALLTFSVSLVAGLGWDVLRDAAAWPRAWKGAFAFAMLAVGLSVVALATASSSVAAASAALVQKSGAGAPAQALELARASGLRALAFSGLLAMALFSWSRLRTMGMVLLAGALCFHAVDVSEVARRYLVFKAPSELMQRPAVLGLLPDPAQGEPYRVLDLPGLWTQNTAALFGYETVLGYHGMEMAAPMKIQDALKGRQLDWLALMNTRYFLSPNPLGIPGLKPLSTSAPYAYEFGAALPRAFLLGSAQAVSSDAQAFVALADPKFDVLHRVTLEADPGLDNRAPTGGVQWLERGRNHLLLSASTQRPALLVLSQTWYPAWQARVDGAPSAVLKADGGALSAVLLPAGAHQVALDYSPAELLWGALLAALGLAGLAVLLWTARSKGTA